MLSAWKRDCSPIPANETLPLQRYPIKIQLALRKRQKETPDHLEKVTATDLLRSGSELEQYEFGVEVSVQDCGIGIGEKDLCVLVKGIHLGLTQAIPGWGRPADRNKQGKPCAFRIVGLA